MMELYNSHQVDPKWIAVDNQVDACRFCDCRTTQRMLGDVILTTYTFKSEFKDREIPSSVCFVNFNKIVIFVSLKKQV